MGKKYKAKRKRKPQIAISSDADESIITHAAVDPVPEHARQACIERSSFDKVIGLINEAKELIVATIQGDAGHYLKGRSENFKKWCDNIISQFTAGKPSHACPYCAGKDKSCISCNGCGWVTLHTFKTSPLAKEGKNENSATLSK